MRRGQRRYAGNDALSSATAVGRAATAILPALSVMWRVAAAANDDLAGQALTANAAASRFQKLRPIAGDEFDPRRGRQIELIGQGAGSLDEAFELDAPRKMADLPHHEPAGRKTDQHLAW